jgi:hypothetical protein
MKRFSEKSIFELIKFTTDVYIESWKQKLHSIFHTNSKILNPSTKGEHEENTKKHYLAIMQIPVKVATYSVLSLPPCELKIS